VLDRAETLRTKRRAAIAQLDTLTQAIFFKMFGDPIQNPHGFSIQPMIDIVDPQRPISYGILMPGPEQAEGVKYVRVVDMKDGGIALPGIRKTTETISNEFRRSLLKSGDLLMSIRGHVGRLAIVPLELDGANITQDTARLAIRGASTIFVRECLRTPGFQRWMEKHTKGVAVRGINLGDVKRMPIIVPPREAQERFTDEVTVVEKLKTAYRASLTEMDALFATLQHRAFRGEL
jgi:type I restriction enzyme S subunit